MEDEARKNDNDAVLRALFSELDHLGIEEFCIVAGARNAPIIAVLTEQSRYTVRNFIDERSAGFFALGRCMSGPHRVAVVTTSGTAAGELLPAMMEAHYRGLSLVAITADRPSRYRRSGAPQAVEQQGIFGPYAAWRWEGRWLLDSLPAEPTLGEAHAATMHFNVCLEEGGARISGEAISESNFQEMCDTRSARMFATFSAAEEDRPGFWSEAGALVVLAAGLRPADVPYVRDVLLDLNAPVVAEVTSNLWDDAALQHLLVQGGERALNGMDVRRVLRLGAVPSWRWWRDLEDRDEIHVLVSDRTAFRGLARTRNVELMQNLPFRELRGEFKDAMQEVVKLNDEAANLGQKLAALCETYPHSEPAWVRHLSRLVPAGATVFLGNSLPIREWNLAAVKPKSGTRFFANRGANGIDGLLSTGFGVGADAEEAWIVVGDLSALYDMNAPWILPQLKNQRWRIVVINNGGGKIFSRVKWLRDLPEEAQRIVENRHSLNFKHWAKQWNLEYRRFDDAAALRDDDAAAVVWEIVPDQEQTEAFWAEWK